MLDARYWILAKKGEIPYSIPAKDGISASLQQVSRNQYPVSLPNESQTSLYGDEALKPKKICQTKNTLSPGSEGRCQKNQGGGLKYESLCLVPIPGSYRLRWQVLDQ